MEPTSFQFQNKYTFTLTHTHIYIYICILCTAIRYPQLSGMLILFDTTSMYITTIYYIYIYIYRRVCIQCILYVNSHKIYCKKLYPSVRRCREIRQLGFMQNASSKQIVVSNSNNNNNNKLGLKQCNVRMLSENKRDSNTRMVCEQLDSK